LHHLGRRVVSVVVPVQVPELNVQNGVLKALSFLFEYIGEMGKDYIYAVTPLLEDALMDRDLVHRQTAASVVQHMALGIAGLGCEDALTHLLNYIWPNIFETSPHVVNAVQGAIDGCRLALGPPIIFNYTMQVLMWALHIVLGMLSILAKDVTFLDKGHSNCSRRHHLVDSIDGALSV
jgi:hypothetical protein